MSMLNLLMNNANFAAEGKFASLWFDQLLLSADDELIESVIHDVADREHWNQDTIKEILKIHVSSTKVIPNVKFIDDDIIEDSNYKMTTQILKEHYATELASPDFYAGAMHEVIMGGAGITSSVKYWMLLNAKENCTFLPMDLERKMLQHMFYDEKNIGYSNFSNIISGVIPDISEYSWDEIIELRNHPYWEQFRNKISELSDEYLDKDTACEIFNEIICKDLIEMAKNLRPQIGKSLVKGMICNIPLPIPINPVSVICTGHDIAKEIDFKKKYGWLYFYLDNKK